MEEKKTKKRFTWIYKLIILMLICVILFSLYKIGTILYGYYSGTHEYKRIEKIASIDKLGGTLDWKVLKKENEQVKAWLYSEDTVINYPIVQGKDNSYYLTRLFNGDWNTKGTLFIDYRCENPFKDFNTIIYGHRMKDGSMFRSIVEYRDDPAYYDKHKTMLLFTEEGSYTVEVFAAVTIPADSDKYKIFFETYSEKEEYLEWISSENVLDTDVSVSADDRIVLLSTCTYEFNDARLVVYGKLVEKE